MFFRNVCTSSLTKRCHTAEDHNLNHVQMSSCHLQGKFLDVMGHDTIRDDEFFLRSSQRVTHRQCQIPHDTVFISLFFLSFFRQLIHFIHCIIHSFIHSFIHPFICSFIRLFVHSLIHKFFHSPIHSIILCYLHVVRIMTLSPCQGRPRV